MTARTKVIGTDDPVQIDNPYLACNSHGLTFLVDTFSGQEVFGHLTLDNTERSPLAELAPELLQAPAYQNTCTG